MSRGQIKQRCSWFKRFKENHHADRCIQFMPLNYIGVNSLKPSRCNNGDCKTVTPKKVGGKNMTQRLHNGASLPLCSSRPGQGGMQQQPADNIKQACGDVKIPPTHICQRAQQPDAETKNKVAAAEFQYKPRGGCQVPCNWSRDAAQHDRVMRSKGLHHLTLPQ